VKRKAYRPRTEERFISWGKIFKGNETIRKYAVLTNNRDKVYLIYGL